MLVWHSVHSTGMCWSVCGADTSCSPSAGIAVAQQGGATDSLPEYEAKQSAGQVGPLCTLSGAASRTRERRARTMERGTPCKSPCVCDRVCVPRLSLSHGDVRLCRPIAFHALALADWVKREYPSIVLAEVQFSEYLPKVQDGTCSAFVVDRPIAVQMAAQNCDLNLGVGPSTS